MDCLLSYRIIIVKGRFTLAEVQGNARVNVLDANFERSYKRKDYVTNERTTRMTCIINTNKLYLLYLTRFLSNIRGVIILHVAMTCFTP